MNASAVASKQPSPGRDYRSHPAADVFPLLEGAAFDALVDDIRQHGQRDPIIMLDGMILDGRNRWRACGVAGLEPITVEWQGSGDPLAFVVSCNLHRRHLSSSERAMIGARIANVKNGDNRGAHRPAEGSANLHSLPDGETSAPEAAELVGVSRRGIFNAKTVIDHGTTEELAEVQAGKSTVSAVAGRIRQRHITAGVEIAPAAVIELRPNIPAARQHRIGRPELPSDATPESSARFERGLEGVIQSCQISRLQYANTPPQISKSCRRPIMSIAVDVEMPR